MTADGVLLVLVGMAMGGALGVCGAWRMARKLEHYGVKLSDWDRPFDLQRRDEPPAVFDARLRRG